MAAGKKLTPENVLSYCERLGLEGARIKEIRHYRNFCATVAAHHRYFLVKQAGSNRSVFSGLSIDKELAVYRLAQTKDSVPAWKSFLVTPVHIDLRHKILVLRYLASYDVLKVSHINETIGAMLGEQLAAIHTLPGELLSELSDISSIHDYIPDFSVITPGHISQGSPLFPYFVQLIQKYPDFLESLEEVRASFRFDCFIHGDLKGDNILIAGNKTHPKIKIIDWELCTKGDRYYDLGYILGSFLYFWIENIRFKGERQLPDHALLSAIKNAFAALLTAYLNRLPDTLSIEYEKLTRFAGLYVFKAFRNAALFKTAFSKHDILKLQIARNLLVFPSNMTPLLFNPAVPVHKTYPQN